MLFVACRPEEVREVSERNPPKFVNAPSKVAVAELCFSVMRQWRIRVPKRSLGLRGVTQVTVEETENECSDDEKHLGEGAAPMPRVRPRPVLDNSRDVR